MPAWRAELPKLIPYPATGRSSDACEQGEPLCAERREGTRRRKKECFLNTDML
jgi:hypothetical protein